MMKIVKPGHNLQGFIKEKYKNSILTRTIKNFSNRCLYLVLDFAHRCSFTNSGYSKFQNLHEILITQIFFLYDINLKNISQPGKSSKIKNRKCPIAEIILFAKICYISYTGLTLR